MGNRVTMRLGLIATKALRPVVLAAVLGVWGPGPCLAQPAATPPAPAPERSATLPDSVVATRESNLVARLREEQARTTPDPDPQRGQRRVDALIDEAGQLADLTQNPTLRMECLSIQLQAIYLRVTRWPEDVGINDYMARLRDGARKIKTVRTADAVAVGDFWLVTAELWELKRSALPLAEQQRQSEQVLRSFIVIHDRGPTVDAARAALRRLNESGIIDPTAEAEPVGEEPTRVSEPIGEALYTLGEPATSPDGVVRVPLRCRYQRGENTLRILQPTDGLKPEEPVRLLLVLPVEAGGGSDFGDPVEVLRKLDVHNRHRLVVVSPTLSDIPWYVDHPTDSKLRQSSYILKAVLPAVRELLPAEQHRVMLLGFSKSGWGAMNLLARNPRDFEAVAVWDTPFMLQDLSYPGMKELFETREHLVRHGLAERFRSSARQFRKDKRIAIVGHEIFGDHHEQFHKLLTELEIPHDYGQGPSRRHRWDSGWVEEAVAALVAMTPTGGQAAASGQ